MRFCLQFVDMLLGFIESTWWISKYVHVCVFGFHYHFQRFYYLQVTYYSLGHVYVNVVANNQHGVGCDNESPIESTLWVKCYPIIISDVCCAHFIPLEGKLEVYHHISELRYLKDCKGWTNGQYYNELLQILGSPKNKMPQGK